MRKGEEIVIGIPSKGSLYEGTLEFLRRAGMPVKYGSQRQYTARLGGIEGFSVLFQRAEEIPVKVAAGAVALGVTGEDIFREKAAGSDRVLLAMRDLGYGHARLVVAVPSNWIDVSSMEELAELALSFRLRHHRNLRIATKFPNLSRRFLAEHGIMDYALVESLGATESAPSTGAAEFVIDLTSSGATLVENNLKTLRDGTIISSQACLIASRQIAGWDEARMEQLETFLDMIESYLRGRETFSIQAAVRRSRIAELTRFASQWRLAYSMPTDETSHQTGDPFVVIRLTCPRNNLHGAVRRLRESGTEEVIVTQPEYVFRAESEAFHKLKRLLKKGATEQAEE